MREERIRRMDRKTDTEISEWRGWWWCVGGGAQPGTGETPLDWFDPTKLPWQQYGRALLLFQAAWGLGHVW